MPSTHCTKSVVNRFGVKHMLFECTQPSLHEPSQPSNVWSSLSLKPLPLSLSLSLSGVDVKEKGLLDEEGGDNPRTKKLRGGGD